MGPVVLILGIETALFGYTVRHDQWRVLNRNFAAYGNVSDIRQYMDDRGDYRRSRTLLQRGLLGYPPVKSNNYSINDHGFRTKQFVPKKSNEYRIGFLGGSTTFGVWLRDHETIPSLFNDAVSRRSLKNQLITVYNLGIEGADLSNEIEIASTLSDRLRFDHLIFYDGANEFHRNYLRHIATQKKNNNHKTAGQSQLIVKATLIQRLLAKILDFEIVQTLKYLILTSQITAKSNIEHSKINDVQIINLSERDANEYLTQYTLAMNFCNMHSIPCSFVIQPIIGHKKSLSKSEKRILSYTDAKYPQYSSYYDLVANLILEKHHENIYDGRDFLIGVDEDVFTDVVHMNVIGNQHVAKSLAQILPL